MFFKKGVLKNFAKFTGKHLCQSLFFIKVAGMKPATLFKKETLAQVFSCEFCEIFKNKIFKNNCFCNSCIMFEIWVCIMKIWYQNKSKKAHDAFFKIASMKSLYELKIYNNTSRNFLKFPDQLFLSKIIHSFFRHC